jgi:hypothetical protein
VSEFEPLDYPAMDEMLIDDFVHILCVHVGVPDSFRVDDEYRTFFAAIHAAGAVNPNLSLPVELERLHPVLGINTHIGRAMVVATGGARFALVDAEKYVMPIVAHD